MAIKVPVRPTKMLQAATVAWSLFLFPEAELLVSKFQCAHAEDLKR